jgi:hypothetical protein
VSEARVVDEHVDRAVERLDPRREVGGLATEVAADHIGLRRQLGGDPLEPIGAAGDQHQAVAAVGELSRELLADPRRRAGHECGLSHGPNPSRPDRIAAAAPRIAAG